MGIQKTKQYLRSCVWFPKMDSLVEAVIRKCIPCQAVTPGTRREPLQMTPLPAEPWQLVAADIFGPLPSGEKILVLKCLRSKWPEVCIFLRGQATNAEGVISAMEKLFSVHGIPDTIRTDNGPPFNSSSYKQFSKQYGFQTQKVTPLWPEANGQAESFMKCLGKVIRTTHVEGRDWKKALNSFLMAYRATPHPSTGVTPADLLYPGRRFKTLLPCPTSPTDNSAVRDFNNRAMARSKAYQDQKRHTKPCSLSLGDTVLVRQQKRNKLTPFYNPAPYRVIAIKGSMVTAQRGGLQIVRNSSFFKQIPPPTQVPAPLTSTAPQRRQASVPLSVPMPLGKSSAPPCARSLAPSTAVFLFPPSSGRGQQGARNIPNPAAPNDLAHHESDEEYVDAEEPVAPEVNQPVAPEPLANNNNPPIVAFHPQPELRVNQQPFALPRDIPTGRYNLRERADRNN